MLRSYCDPKNKENCRCRQLLVALGDLDSYVGLQALGSQVVCNSRTIAEVCKRAPYVGSPRDLSSISGLRPQFYEPMYNIMISLLPMALVKADVEIG